MRLSKDISNQGRRRKTNYNKRFKTEVKSSSLTEEEKRKLLFEVFDILLAAKKTKAFRVRRKESDVTRIIL